MYTRESIEGLRECISLDAVIRESLDHEFDKYNGNDEHIETFWDCPFCSDGRLELYDDDHYHCNECNAHGDAIAFLMLHEKLSFAESVEKLASSFGVELEKADKKPRNPLEAKINYADNLDTKKCQLFVREMFIKWIHALKGTASREKAIEEIKDCLDEICSPNLHLAKRIMNNTEMSDEETRLILTLLREKDLKETT